MKRFSVIALGLFSFISFNSFAQNCSQELDAFFETNYYPRLQHEVNLANSRSQTIRMMNLHRALEMIITPQTYSREIIANLNQVGDQALNGKYQAKSSLQDITRVREAALESSRKLSQCTIAINRIDCLPYTSNAINMQDLFLRRTSEFFRGVENKFIESSAFYFNNARDIEYGRIQFPDNMKLGLDIMVSLNTKFPDEVKALEVYMAEFSQAESLARECLK